MSRKKDGDGYEEPFTLDLDPDEALERFALTDPDEADALAKDAGAGQFEESESHDTGDRLLPYVGKNGVQVDLIVEGGSFWASQGQIADIFGIDRSVVSKHIKKIVADGELSEEGNVHLVHISPTRPTKLYNLDMVISVGYRVEARNGTLFRMWATDKLVQYLTKGFVMDDERLKNPASSGQSDYFDELLARVRDIRSSEARMWMRVLEFAEFCSDYDKNSTTQGATFFAEIQNTMHWAVHQNTAAGLIRDRVHADKPNAGVISFKGKMPTVDEAATAKNLLAEAEIAALNHITSLVLEFFESQVEQRRLTTLPEFVSKMRQLVSLDGRPLKKLNYAGEVSGPAARKWASDQVGEWKRRQKALKEAAGEKALSDLAGKVKALSKHKPKKKDS